MTTIRQGEEINWADYTEADGTFEIPAESALNIGAEYYDEDGNRLVGDTSAPVVLELRTGNCEVFGYMGPDGGMVERKEGRCSSW